MKHILAILILLTTLVSCQRTGTLNRKFLILSQEEFLKDNYDCRISTLSILNKYTISVKAKARHDTGNVFYGIQDYYEDDEDSLYRHIVIGKLIDSTRIFATEINTRDYYINFYTYKGNKWEKLGTEEIDEYTMHIRFKDLNRDNKKEIITSTNPNMNGNRWLKIYKYSEINNSIALGGNTTCPFTLPLVDKQSKNIVEYYSGSYWMDEFKTEYEWSGDLLIPRKRIILAKDSLYDENSKIKFEYYENKTDSINGLKLLFSEPYDEKNVWLIHQWEKFFEYNGIE